LGFDEQAKKDILMSADISKANKQRELPGTDCLLALIYQHSSQMPAAIKQAENCLDSYDVSLQSG
jgi:hypothetical protein